MVDGSSESVKQRIRVGVLFGGRSCEHEVSLQSAKAIIDALDRERYEVVPIGVTKQGQWVRLPASAIESGFSLEDFCDDRVALLPTPNGRSLVAAGESANKPDTDSVGEQIDVIFPIIHGPMGEDGTVQGLFELAGVPYVGAGVLGSAVGMDKAVMKVLFQSQGLPVAEYCVVMRAHWTADPASVLRDTEAQFKYPWFVKPANMGSSVGVSKVHDATEFANAMSLAARFDRKIVIERAIENAREIEVAVLGNDDPQASVAGEILPSNEFYDYSAKYIDGRSGLAIPAELPEPTIARLRMLAVQAFKAIDCCGMARVDFLVQDNGAQIYLLEANTLPGFTPISMYPKLWEASGVSYPDLVQRLIELALERHEDRAQNATSLAELEGAR
ncbi:MAG: D-alanine-D-alanine ligase [Gammaproteobacteria bacterium]|jgi:D-alanine-D-alanine ligase